MGFQAPFPFFFPFLSFFVGLRFDFEEVEEGYAFCKDQTLMLIRTLMSSFLFFFSFLHILCLYTALENTKKEEEKMWNIKSRVYI